MSVTMKWFPLAIALSLGTTAAVAEEAWQQQEQAREQQAQQDLASVSKELNSARAKLAAAQSLSKQLAAEFAGNEKQLVELNAQWEQASGDMNEIFAVTRQGASDAVKLLSESAVEGQYPERLAPLKAMAQEKQVPDRAALALLPATLLQEIRESGRVAQFTGKVLDAQGAASEQSLTRVGSFALLGSEGFLQPTAEGLSPVLGLPGSVLSRRPPIRVRRGKRCRWIPPTAPCWRCWHKPPPSGSKSSRVARSAPLSCCWPLLAWGSPGYGCGASPASWVGFVASSRAVNITPTMPSAGC